MSGTTPAGAADIREILGSVDEVVLADLLRIGPTAAEVQEAVMRLDADDAVWREARRSPSPRVVAVMEVLAAAELGGREAE
ncbi:hypothetical protein [Neoroseomonas lacus]|uniref:Uncharacterized protein n=1 Tax=Neoroseomonas lacus TaxID=287609 RepID=A0A917NVZ3_9PROT|nr:hypothetical protein [Neoroseomonas lacus]GGJ34565.1 hypothetical protein GCM10011320_47880 [Neoroseomonas lacus]